MSGRTSAPQTLVLSLADVVGAVRHRTSEARPVAEKKLQRRLQGGVTESEVELIARRHFQFMERTAFLKTWPRLADRVAASCRIVGRDHLDGALESGRGALLVSAHFGYTRLIKPVLRQHGYPARVVGPRRETSSGRARGFGRIRSSWSAGGMAADLAAELDVRPLVAALARNDVLVALPDTDKAAAIRRIDVLGRPVSFASGVASLARATGAPLLPAFVVEDETRKPRLDILPPLDLQVTTDPAADAEANLRAFVSVFERYVETYPHLWRHWTGKWRRAERRRQPRKDAASDASSRASDGDANASGSR